MKILIRQSLLTALVALAAAATAQESSAPRVQIDCGGCDMDYLRREIDYVNHVRDRLEAQIYVLATSEASGGGGRLYTLTFTGREQFTGLADTLTYAQRPDDSADERRDRMRRAVELGLVRYLARTPLAENYDIGYAAPFTASSDPAVDPWNSWVFKVGAGGWLSGQKSYDSKSVWGSLAANRITEEWKLEFSHSGQYDAENYDLGDGVTLESNTRSFTGYQRLVKSLGGNWSAGATMRQRSSSFENVDFFATLMPALEYSYFPYGESSRRSLVFRYAVGGGRYDYEEETIYDKLQETLFLQRLDADLDLIQDWGSVGLSAGGQHYFEDFDYNQLVMSGNVSIWLMGGLSASLYGSYSVIHDQLSLRKGNATDEQVLLQRRQLATRYSYTLSAGINYSFGSIYNNVVNPRF